MEAVYKTYKPAWRSFYKSIFLMILILVLAGLVNYFKPDYAKWAWIIAVAVDVVIFILICIKRMTVSLILRDDPDKPENQEIACTKIKPFSSSFRQSIEIGLSEIVDIKVNQSIMQILLRVGDIIITSSGTGGQEIIAENIPNPSEVRDEIQKHKRRHTA